MTTAPGETGLENLDGAGPLTQHEQKRLAQALRFDAHRLTLAFTSALLSVLAFLGLIVWLAWTAQPFTWERVSVTALVLVFCGTMLRFSGNIGMRVSDSVEITRRGSRTEHSPADLVEALKIVADTIKEVLGKKGGP